MTRLSDLAILIDDKSPRIKAFAVEAAAEVDDLRARVGRLESAAPPVPAPPPPAPSPGWPPAGAWIAEDWSRGIRSPWSMAGGAADISIRDDPVRPGRKALALTAGEGSAPPGGDPNTGGNLSTLTSVFLPRASGVSHVAEGAETWEHWECYFPPGSQFSAGDWNYVMENHPSFTGAYGSGVRVVADGDATSTVPGTSPSLGIAIRGGSKANESRRYFTLPETLTLGRWYDMLVHKRWSSDPAKGFSEWWVDGQLRFSLAAPNTYSDDPVMNFGLYNYIRNVPWRLTILYGRVAIGRTRADVGAL